MDMETFYELGYQLKTKRKARGLSLDDISLRIKIPTKTLYSIEEALQDGLPQPIYARGFIISYAKALEMDMEEVARQIEVIYPSSDLNNIKEDMSHGSREHSAEFANVPQKGRGMAMVVLVALVLVLVVGFFLYDYLGLDWLDFLKPKSEVGAALVLPRETLEAPAALAAFVREGRAAG